MKITDRTLSILKNFADIGTHIIIKPGNILRVMGGGGSILAKAIVEDEFPCEIPIYELNKLLSSIALFHDPDIEFHSKYLTISSGNSKIKFTYADPEILESPPDGVLELEEVLETVRLTEEQLLSIDRTSKTLGLKEVSFESDGEDFYLKLIDAEGATANEFAIKIGNSSNKFKIVIPAKGLKMIPQNYDVTIEGRGFTYWKGDGIEYWIVASAEHSVV